MEVVVQSKTAIRRSLVGYIPVLISAGIFYFFLGTGAIIWLLKGHMTVPQIRAIVLSVPALVVLAGGTLYVRFVVNRLSRSFLSFSGEVLIVRGQTSRGYRERTYPVDDIKSITVGVKLNALERGLDVLRQFHIPRTGAMGLVKDLKAGRLEIIDISGGRQTFHFVDKVFDQRSLRHFADELRGCGVNISGTL